jgi:hypothetical protein
LRLWLCSGPPHNHHSRVHEALREEAPVELWVVKNRSGPVPLEPITLLFDGALGSFRASDRSLR